MMPLQQSTVRVCSVQTHSLQTDEGQRVPLHSLASSAQCTNSACEMCYRALSAAHQREQEAVLRRHAHSTIKFFSTSSPSAFISAALNGGNIVSKLCHVLSFLTFSQLFTDGYLRRLWKRSFLLTSHTKKLEEVKTGNLFQLSTSNLSTIIYLSDDRHHPISPLNAFGEGI